MTAGGAPASPLPALAAVLFGNNWPTKLDQSMVVVVF